jgi:transcriptional antiterminator RfaH
MISKSSNDRCCEKSGQPTVFRFAGFLKIWNLKLFSRSSPCLHPIVTRHSDLLMASPFAGNGAKQGSLASEQSVDRSANPEDHSSSWAPADAGVGRNGACARETGRACAPDSARRWHAVATQPHREELACAHLVNQGFEPFLPRRRKTVRHARRITTRSAAFFPGYLFLPLDQSAHRWRSVNGTIGVRSLVMNGDRPALVPAGIVEELLARTGTDGYLAPMTTEDFAVGQQVRVLCGPFGELVGVLERLEGQDRVRVLLKILSGEMKVTLPRRDVVPIHAGEHEPALRRAG